MKRIFVVLISAAGIVYLSACNGNSPQQPEEVDTAATETIQIPKDTVKPNIGEWTATVKMGSKGNNGKLSVMGSINADPKAIVRLTKAKSAKVNPNELRLQISYEPKADQTGNTTVVNYEENLKDVNKYNKVTVFYNDKLVSVVNVERAK